MSPLFAALIPVEGKEAQAIASLLIKAKADVKESDPGTGQSALYHCVVRNPSLVPWLITQGGSVNAKDNRGVTPLMACVQSKQSASLGATIQHLLLKKASSRVQVTPCPNQPTLNTNPSLPAIDGIVTN